MSSEHSVCGSVNTGNCVYANKMQQRCFSSHLRRNCQRWAVETCTAYLWSEILLTAAAVVLSAWFLHQFTLFISHPTPPLPLDTWKWERWQNWYKNSTWVELLCISWAMVTAVRKSLVHISRACYSPASSEKPADVPKLLRFLKVAKNNVKVLGVKSTGKLGRRGVALPFLHIAEARSKCISTARV